MGEAAVEKITVTRAKNRNIPVHRDLYLSRNDYTGLFALMGEKLRTGIGAGRIGFMQNLQAVFLRIP